MTYPKIIFGFPAIGKTYLASALNEVGGLRASEINMEPFKREDNTIDLESCHEYIKDLLSAGSDFIFLDTDIDLINKVYESKDIKASVIIASPSFLKRDEYLLAALEKGASPEQIKNILSNWEPFFEGLKKGTLPRWATKVRVDPGNSLSDHIEINLEKALRKQLYLYDTIDYNSAKNITDFLTNYGQDKEAEIDLAINISVHGLDILTTDYIGEIPVIDSEITGQSRWETQGYNIYSLNGLYLREDFSQGSTEMQEGSPSSYSIVKRHKEVKIVYSYY